jgi:polyvinyl alcohol dehydrogenase (cytochrome)
VVDETVGFHHTLVGLSVKDGRIRVTREILVPDGNPQNDQQRAALLLSRGRVYVAFGGLSGGCGQYIGSIVGVPVSGRGNVVSWKVPTTRGGGIWATGGPTAGPDGTIYVAAGNGLGTFVRFDGSDSVTALTPDLQVKSQFGPASWASDNAAGLDLGSMSPALVAGTVLAVGKSGIAYLMHARNLKGLGGEIAQARVCAAYGGPSVQGDTAYLPCAVGTRAVGTVGGRIKVLWRGPELTNGSPVVGGAVVWTTGGGNLFALDQGTGKVLDKIDVGKLPPFASPTLSGGLVLLGTMRGVVAVAGA